MKTFDERMQAILKKAKIQKAVRRTLKTAATVLGAAALVLALKQLPAWYLSRQLDVPAAQQPDAPTENPAPTQPFWTMGPPSELDVPCDYLDFASVNVKTGMPSQKDTYPAIHLIRSAEALRNFCQQRQQEYSGFERVENQAACYDDTFFADSSLIILMFVESSGSVQHQVVDVEVYENGYINILVDRNVPEIGTCDMAYWYIFVEVDAIIAEDTWIGYECVDPLATIPDTDDPLDKIPQWELEKMRQVYIDQFTKPSDGYTADDVWRLRVVAAFDDRYVLFVDDTIFAYLTWIASETVNGYKFVYGSSQTMYLYYDGYYYRLQDAYDAQLISDDELQVLYEQYTAKDITVIVFDE